MSQPVKPIVLTSSNPAFTLIAEPRGYNGAKAFSSGKSGFYAGGKVVIVDEGGNVKQYQVSCSIVEIVR